MKAHPYLTRAAYTRAAAYFQNLTAFLKEDARRTGHWEDFVWMCGPELRRHSWQEQLYDPVTLQEIDRAMRGKEELYSDTYDMLNLLKLQFDQITLQQQHDVSMSIAMQTGLIIPPTSIVWMSAQEIEAATMRLAIASVGPDPDLQTPLVMKLLQWNVPFVLHTAEMTHTLPGWGRVQPTKLPLPMFRVWFQERLVRTVIARSQHAPEHPWWVLPDGSIQSTRHLVDPREVRMAYIQFGELIQRVCEPAPRGRRRGSGGRFDDVEDFRQTVICDLRALRQQRRETTQLELARLWYQNDHDPAAKLDSLVAEIKRYCHNYGIPWEILVAEARRT